MSFAQQFHPLNFSAASASQLLLVPSVVNGLSSRDSGMPTVCTSAVSTPSFSAPSLINSSGQLHPEMSAETLRILAAGHAGLAHLGFPPRLDNPSMPGLPTSLPLGPPGMPPLPFYPGMPPDMKSPDGMHPQSLPGYFYDPMSYPYGGPLDLNGARRKNATRETTAALKAWLYEHRKNPYPTKGEKIMLAIITKMTLTQVSTWFANARRRLKKENKMTWSPRNRPGEDDDLGDDPGADRPTSSLSGASLDDVPDGTTMLNHDKKDLSLNSSDEQLSPLSLKRPFVDDGAAKEEEKAPEAKKPKIWSIADTVGEGSSSASNNSDSHPTSSSPSPSQGPKKPDSSGPFHFTFNPWQQQMQSLMGGVRPPSMLLSPPGGPGPSVPFPAFPPGLQSSMMAPFPAHPAFAAQMRPEFWGAMARSGAFGPFMAAATSAAAMTAPSTQALSAIRTTARAADSTVSKDASRTPSPAHAKHDETQ